MTAFDLFLILTLLTVNAASVVLVSMSLPGTWTILLATALLAWFRWEERLFGPVTLMVLASLGVLGEILELVAGALGAKKAGGTAWGAVGAMVLGVVGGIAGTFYLPVIGSILGAASGAFAGALLGERLRGRSVEAAAATGRGAFVGRLLGSLLKVGIAVVMWFFVAFAAFL